MSALSRKSAGTRAPPPDRILILVVAYDAERHIRQVFERIPAGLYRADNVEIVCIDDASGDEGAALLVAWLRDEGFPNVTVLRNSLNQGYGGNQKLGYRLAIERGADFVILLHGDAQYAPESIPEFIESWQRSRADVVLGSRMLEPGGARRGGMPLYKRIGNRVLTWIQNRFTGLGLSEYHTGYRGYSTSFLKRIPFEIDTNDFHFDTEILLQAAHVGARIVELPIPTRYGDEVCHVPSVRYSWNVLRSTIHFKLHQMGMLCSLKFRNLGADRYVDKSNAPYSSHALALRIVEALGARRVLDIGCARGWLARRLHDLGIEVTGIDREEPDRSAIDVFHRVDLERDPLPVDPFAFDVVLLLDVIEHLADPESFLVALRNSSRALRPGGSEPRILVSTPNVAFAMVRLNLLLGRFPYAERGILDVTHKRLFTRGSLLRMLRDCGYRIDRVTPIAVPFRAVVGGAVGRLLERLAAFAAGLWPTLFAFQFLVECHPLPGIASILEDSEIRWPPVSSSRDEDLQVSGTTATPESSERVRRRLGS
jgi:2-polyprenyl-3-methyl-5-hydroxy-6-metoxy-1,4-benzoquinol methylase